MKVDVVLDGGGVRGIALVGAISVLEDSGYEFSRVAGTSAGAIVGSLLAAGMTSKELKAAVDDLDYRRFEDRSKAHRVPLLGKGLSLLVGKGVYGGRYLTTWLGELLAARGVRTFGDLRMDDDVDSPVPPSRRYRLVVTALDVSHGTLLRLPWDYHRYGLDPDEQPVAEAVRASASVPFFFEPVQLHHASGDTSLLVDGGVVADFPVGIFDRSDGAPPRWPTLGLKLSGAPVPQHGRLDRRHAISGPVSLGIAMLSAMRNVHEQRSFSGEDSLGRTMFIDTGTAGGRADFGIGPVARQALYVAGRKSAADFLDTAGPCGIAGAGRPRAPLALLPTTVSA
jgi:NTE family protein